MPDPSSIEQAAPAGMTGTVLVIIAFLGLVQAVLIAGINAWVSRRNLRDQVGKKNGRGDVYAILGRLEDGLAGVQRKVDNAASKDDVEALRLELRQHIDAELDRYGSINQRIDNVLAVAVGGSAA